MSNNNARPSLEPKRHLVDADELDPAEIIGPPRMEIKTATRVLSRLDPPGSEVDPKDSLQLFAAVGRLRFTDWDFVDILWTSERKRGVEAAAGELYRRLAERVSRFGKPVLEGLAEGIEDAVADIEEGMRRSEEYLRSTGEPWRGHESIEFCSWVTYPLAQVGFAKVVCDALGIQLPPRVTARLEKLDGDLRRSLPVIAEAFRKAGEPIDPVEPRMFPASFWWARPAGSEAGPEG